MKNLLNFFIEVGKLKGKKRRGMMFYGIKDSETTAEHTFRMTIIAWFFGRLKNLNIEKVIKMSLIHDLCEVYAGDITPYDGLLPKNKKKRYEFVREWPPRCSIKEKERSYAKRIKTEKEALEKLTRNLPQKLKKEIINLWWDYETGVSKEGRIVAQIDRLENLLEALNCWERDKNFPTKPWWQHAEEYIDNPTLSKFLKEIEIEELKDKKAERDPFMKNLLNFLSEIGKLKKMSRRGWVINRIKNPESIAEHIFRTAIMTWILGEKKGGLNIERLLKMSLIHDLCEVYAGDTTPYDTVLPKNEKKLKELMKTWPRFSATEKKKMVREKYKKELKALEKLISKLPLDLKKEIKNLWLDYEKGLTPEGRFFQQADRIENFLQALEYWKRYKKPPQKPWWLWAREFFDEPLLLEFIKEMDKKFHKKIKPRI